MLLQWPIGRLSDVIDRRRVIVAATAVSTIVAASAIFAPHFMQKKAPAVTSVPQRLHSVVGSMTHRELKSSVFPLHELDPRLYRSPPGLLHLLAELRVVFPDRLDKALHEERI